MALPESLLDQLSALLERMTRPDGRPSHVPKSSPRELWLWLLFMTIIFTIAFVFVALILRRDSAGMPVHLHFGWALLPLLPATGLLLLAVYDLAQVIREEWRNPWGTIFQQLQSDLRADAAYVAELKAFPKEMLEYALLQYRHRWGRVDGRTLLLAGDIRKLGLLPGLLAIFVAAPKLLDSQSTLWVWQPLVLVGVFQLAAFFVGATSERRTQVIELIQHAINYTDAHPLPEPSRSDAQQANQPLSHGESSGP